MSDAQVEFRTLHADGCFVIPNPWDVGSAKYLAAAGFRALATTSGGMAHAMGLPDGSVALEDALAHIEAIVGATALPVNADFGNAFADSPGEVAANVRRCVETGVAGLSVEDSTTDGAAPLYALDLATERVAAARAAIDASGEDVLLTARAENFVTGVRDLDDTITRLAAYKAAGADVLFAPGIRGDDQISAVVSAASPLPVNVLALPKCGMTVTGLQALGVRRISVGSILSRMAWVGFAQAADAIARDGDFSAIDASVDAPNLNALFSTSPSV